MNTTSTLLSCEDVSLAFNQQTVLHKVSFSMNNEEIVTIIGPNGAGKSTLLKVIAGLQKADSGKVTSAKGLKLAYVPQKIRLDGNLPIKVSRFLSLNRAAKQSSVSALESVGAEHLWDKQLISLSGGELQRVLLARAIARSPDLLLLDEPLQGVDLAGQTELYRLIAKLREDFSCAVLMVSHDLHLVMAQTDQVLCLNQHLCCHGKPESVSQHPEYLKLFGAQGASELAVYTHHHDHHHDISGDAIKCSSECAHD